MNRLLIFALTFAAFQVSAPAQEVPSLLRGTWRITRVLRTATISCWGSTDARTLLGTTIEYTQTSLRWKDRVASNLVVSISTVDAETFHDNNSGGGANDSQVTFAQLGIEAPTATQIVLTHSDIKPIRGSYDLPGDAVLIKNRNAIIFSVCNLYFEAKRELPTKPSH